MDAVYFASPADLIEHRTRFSGNSEAVYEVATGNRYTYNELADRSLRLAYFLTNVLGLKKGDRVGFCTANCIAHIDMLLAGLRTGIAIVTYNVMLKPKDLLGMVISEEPSLLFYASRLEPLAVAMAQAVGHCGKICLDGKSDQDQYCYEDIMNMEVPPDCVWPAPKMEDLQMLVHTGGTTGIPKAAMLSFRSVYENALSETMTVGLSNRDCAYVCMPLFHTAGWNIWTIPLLLNGGRVILDAAFDPGRALALIQAERPTGMMAVETVYRAMAAHPDFMKTDFSCFRLMITGAAPTSYETLDIYWKRGLRLVNSYGMTEYGPNGMTFSVEEPEEVLHEKWNSVGKPMFFNELRLVDEEGRDVPVGEKGEILWRGSLMFSGYWKNEEETARVMEDGWLHSGDVAYMDSEGYIYVCDRLKNMYINMGENVFPAEVENTLSNHPSVAECCVIGVPDPDRGEVGRALIVLEAGATLTREELLIFAKEELATIKVPTYVTFVEKIPVNSLNKRDMLLLHELYGAAED